MSDTELKQPRILVVDDEQIVVSLVRDALEDEDLVVETALTPQEALQWVGRESFDLIITDIRMPGMDGIELVRKSHEQQPDMGVIFMTGYANLASAKNAIKQGAFDYIMKPFELSEIRQAVRNALQVRQNAKSKSSEQELSRLSDLSQMLFTANDRVSLITSSLKFIMMHQRVAQGAVLLCDREGDTCTEITITGEEQSQTTRPFNPQIDIAARSRINDLRFPFVIGKIEDHPVYQVSPDKELRPLLLPAWSKEGQPLLVVSIVRASTLFGWFVLGLAEDTARSTDADLKFLAITASQLAMTLENLTLLEETQKAYANLRELQDETIRLEKVATRGEMSAEIGHEMNNFVGVVAGNLSLLDFHIRRGNTKELGKYVTAMTETIEKIKKFTANLMDLTPISSDKAVISFGQFLHEVVDFLKPQKRYRNVQIKIDTVAENLPFEADSTQLQQLLYNLFNNAADSMIDSALKEITVRIDCLEDEGRFRFAISDHGCGMPPELLQKAFQERFTTKKLGHGFGLVVCKRIIENHGGELQVESTPNVGTTISIRFPIAGMAQKPVKAEDPTNSYDEQIIVPAACGFRAV